MAKLTQRRYEPTQARAAAIRKAREWAGMSKYDLAAALGVSRATIRCWEAAVLDPGPDMTWRIAVATRVRASVLLMPPAELRVSSLAARVSPVGEITRRRAA